MKDEIVRAIVHGIRAQVAALEEQIVALEVALGVEAPPQCQHPQDMRQTGNFGQPEVCGLCGATV